MAGRLVDLVNRAIRSGLASISEGEADSTTRNDKALVVVRHQLGQMIVHRRNLERELASPPPEARELTAKAEMAVRKGREDLARAAMAEIAKMTSGRQAMTDEIANLDADIAVLEAAIAKLTGQTPVADAIDRASLQALLAELDRLNTETDKGRRSQDT